MEVGSRSYKSIRVRSGIKNATFLTPSGRVDLHNLLVKINLYSVEATIVASFR